MFHCCKAQTKVRDQLKTKKYRSILALLCASTLLLSIILFPLKPFPNAYAEGLDSPREKKDKVPKIDSETLKLKSQAISKQEATDSDSATDVISVVLELDGRATPTKIKELTKLGIKIEADWQNLVQVLVPADQIDAVASIKFVKYIRQPIYVIPTSISEGADLIGADEINAAGFTGKDVKIAVIDLGFDLANPEIASN